jgi:hypothetical protein
MYREMEWAHVGREELGGTGPLPLRPPPFGTAPFISEEAVMSYPTPRYLGKNGEISAAFRPASTEPELSSAGQRIYYLATHASTRGDFGLYRVDMAPRSPGPSTHFHRTISESFFILAGAVQLFDGERWVRATMPPAALKWPSRHRTQTTRTPHRQVAHACAGPRGVVGQHRSHPDGDQGGAVRALSHPHRAACQPMDHSRAYRNADRRARGREVEGSA